MDKNIRVYSLDGTLVRTLVGHEHGVISLDWSAAGLLISGSWDQTARVWNIADGTCVQTLPDHENGVNVLGLPNGNIVTASTGRQEGNTVVDFKIRIWENGSVVKTMQPHLAAVRNLTLLPDLGFASCSNDGYLIACIPFAFTYTRT
jgi:phospholipase A-2-activating protein